MIDKENEIDLEDLFGELESDIAKIRDSNAERNA